MIKMIIVSVYQAVVGSIVWALRRLKKPRSREMSARGYALHSVRPQLYFSNFQYAEAGLKYTVTSFKDKRLADSKLIAELVNTIRANVVNMACLRDETDEEVRTYMC